MVNLLLVFFGGGLGAAARYGAGLGYARALGPSTALPATFVINVLGGLFMLAIVTIFVLWWKLRVLGGRNGGAYSGIDGTMEEERERLRPKQGLRQLSLVR